VAGLPVHALLGGRRQETLPLYHSITCIEPEEMARIAREAQAQGITQFQVKLGASGDWQTDVERLARVREAVGPGPLVYGDWNCGATTLDAIRVGRGAAHLDVMLEQPCATLEECARVQAATGLPMKMDELAHDTASMLAAHRFGIMDAVALKLSKFGGLSATRRARDLCLHLGAKMCVECTWGSDIVTAAALHLGAATRPDRVLNVCDLSGYVSPRLASDAPDRAAGRIAPPDGPGLGITVDQDRLGTPDLILE
jgi:L-alanine-DL-glutamate epimerase-like enolase superfamily enzyme